MIPQRWFPARKNSGVLSCILLATLTVTAGCAPPGHDAHAGDCMSNLCTLHTHIHDYHAKYKHFPPAYVLGPDGRPAHSWRVLLLEFLDPKLYLEYDFNEPWDGPNNRKLAEKMPRWYRCPNAPELEKATRTSYVVLVGDDTVFPGTRVTSMDDIKDPLSETILLVEAEGLHVHWMEPRDLDVGSMALTVGSPDKPGLSSYDRAGPAVICVDFSRFRLYSSAPPEQIKAMSTIAGGEKVDLSLVTDLKKRYSGRGY
jgi:hypothetical protein